MATKLRSSKIFRFIGILLVSLSISTMIAYAIISFKFDYRNTISFYETHDFHRFIQEQQNAIQLILSSYKGKEKIVPIENIKVTDLVNENDVKTRFQEHNKYYEEKVVSINETYDNNKKQAIDNEYGKSRIAEIEDERTRALKDLKQFNYRSEEAIRKELEDSALSGYKNNISCLGETRIKYIATTDDGKVLSNLKVDYSEEVLNKYKKSSDFFIVLRAENLDDSSKINESNYSKEGFDSFLKENKENIKSLKDQKIKLMAFFVKDDDLIGSDISSDKKNYDFYMTNREFIQNIFKAAIVTFFVGIVILLLSKVKEESIIQKIYKWLYFELGLGIQVIGVIAGYVFSYEFFTIGYRWYGSYIRYDYLIALSLYIIFEYYLLVYFISSIKDIIKNKKIKQKLLIYILFNKCTKFIKNIIKDVFSYKSTRFKFIIFAVFTLIFILICLIIGVESFFRGGLFIVLPYSLLYFGVLFAYGFKFTKHLNKILDGTNKISEGDLNYIIEEKGVNILGKLAKNINNLKSGLKDALGKEMKSERMKSELITNVSHDLKTPLTSIINYVDLLKKEGIESERSKDYIEILDRKSQRLKVLIEDLFEASKATSGSMDMNIEKIEITELLKQTLAEFEEKIADSRLNFKVDLGAEKVYVMGDGRRTYRVFENLIQNILKYSLTGTRVYINLIQEDDCIKLIMKNIAAYEMNFDATEIAERFKRGDLSRNTEGSGLGLAIAKSIMDLQNGELNLEVDGDLFKSIVVFRNL